jgi:hypothetical protein
MIQRPHTVFVRHFAAMQLILSMQNADGSTPNVDYVRSNPKAPKVADWPGSMTSKYEGFKYLKDMLPLIDPAVYSAFHDMLTSSMNVSGILLNAATVEQNAKFTAAMLQRTGDTGGKFFWVGDPPHGCYWIMREAVAELLS